MTSFFPLQAQQEVWDDPDNLLAVSYTPSPKVEVVDGGIKIAGSWPWASVRPGSFYRRSFPARTRRRTLAWCLVPVADVIVDHDSWNVSDLQWYRLEGGALSRAQRRFSSRARRARSALP